MGESWKAFYINAVCAGTGCHPDREPVLLGSGPWVRAEGPGRGTQSQEGPQLLLYTLKEEGGRKRAVGGRWKCLKKDWSLGVLPVVFTSSWPQSRILEALQS